jgi:hypothetical protein
MFSGALASRCCRTPAEPARVATETEFNGIGGPANLHRDCADKRHLFGLESGLPMQEIYAIFAVGGAAIALAGACSLWVLNRKS